MTLKNDKEKLSLIRKKANNALYFADNSDYVSTLWEILEVITPDIFADDPVPVLKYIDEDTEAL